MHEVAKLLQPIKNKLMLIVGRCILTAITNTGKTQIVSGTALGGNEKFSDIEHIENYGLTAVAPTDGSEGVVVSPNGNRGNAIIIIVANKELRPKTLSSGDVCLYDSRGVQVLLDILGITLKSGDASAWCPSVMAVCPYTGAPHGGIGAGILKLKGG